MGGEARHPFFNFILGVLRRDRDTGLMFMNSFKIFKYICNKHGKTMIENPQ